MKKKNLYKFKCQACGFKFYVNKKYLEDIPNIWFTCPNCGNNKFTFRRLKLKKWQKKKLSPKIV